VGYSLVFAGLACCSWVNFVDACSYRRVLQLLELSTEFTIAVSARGAPLTTEEIKWLTSAGPEEGRALVQFVVDRGYCGSRTLTFDIEHHEELPSLIHGATNVRTEEGHLRFAGGGHVYNEYSCSESSGRLIRMSADVSTVGIATVGMIVLRPDGSERTHATVAVSSDGEFAPLVVRGRARPGDRIQLYVYAGETDKDVEIRSFRVDMVDAPFEPEPH
jgi:hypothetical protein